MHADTLSVVFLFAQTLVQLRAFWLYDRNVDERKTESSVVTWFLWPVLTGVLAVNYLVIAVRSQNMLTGIQNAMMPLISTMLSVCILWRLLAVRRQRIAESSLVVEEPGSSPGIGRILKLFNGWEWTAIVFGIIGVTVWLSYGRPAEGIGHIFLIAANVVKFLPMGYFVWKGHPENAKPHLVWCFAGLLWLIEVVLTKGLIFLSGEEFLAGRWFILLYPALFILVHGTFAALGYRQKRMSMRGRLVAA